MANVQFCPVCGYALKKVENQCGRCGESIGEKVEQPRQAPKQQSRSDRFQGTYSIEAISMRGDMQGNTAAPMHLPDYGVREVNEKQSRYEERGGSVHELQKELRDLNERIARIDEEKKNDPQGSRGQVPSTPAVSFKSDVVRHLRRRSDSEFKALVAAHVSAIRGNLLSRKVSGNGQSSVFHKFIDDKLVSPGVFDSSVTLFVGPSGSMKSTMAAYTAAQMAKYTGGRVLYLLLDEDRTKFETRLGQLNIMTKKEGSIRVVDSLEVREKTTDLPGNWRRVMMEYVRREFERDAFEFIVVDNINAIHSMVSNERERSATFEFFDWLRELGLTSIVIKEGDYSKTVRGKAAEAYLADGVVQFHRRKRYDGSLVPMFRVLKMRGAEIDSKYYALQVSSGNLRFVPAVEA